jgi:hypothetical protein
MVDQSVGIKLVVAAHIMAPAEPVAMALALADLKPVTRLAVTGSSWAERVGAVVVEVQNGAHSVLVQAVGSC